MVESGRVPGKGRIRATIEKLSWIVPEKGRISVSTEKWWNPDEYREKVESVCGPLPDPPDRRDSLLKEKKENEKKLVFSSFEKPTLGEERCCLESPLTFYFCF